MVLHPCLFHCLCPPWASQAALVVKNPTSSARDIRDSSWIPGSGRSAGGGHGNPLQYSCLENPHGQRSPGGGGVATVHGVARSRIRQKQLSSRSSSRVCQAWTWSVTMCCPSPPPQTHADQDLGFLFVVLGAQLSLALCSPTDCSAPGSSVHAISPARTLEWVAISFSRGSCQPGIEPASAALAGGFFTTEPPEKP